MANLFEHKLNAKHAFVKYININIGTKLYLRQIPNGEGNFCWRKNYLLKNNVLVYKLQNQKSLLRYRF